MKKRIPLIAGLILTALTLWAWMIPTKNMKIIFNRLENFHYDLALQARLLTHPEKPVAAIAIVDINDASLKKEGRWPWPRNKLANLVDQIAKLGARVIVFDILFPEPQLNLARRLSNELAHLNLLTPTLKKALLKYQSHFDYDALFAKALNRNNSILSISFLPQPKQQNILPPALFPFASASFIRAFGYISNVPVLQNAAQQAGFVNIFPDPDGIIRRSPLLLNFNNQLYPTLALQAVLTFLNTDIQLIQAQHFNQSTIEGLHLPHKNIKTDASTEVYIPFIGPSYTFPYFSATEILQGKLPEKTLVGKIVFIGTSATGLGDLQASAVQNPFPGVEIQATIAQGLLSNSFSYQPSWEKGANFIFILILGMMGSFLFPKFNPKNLIIINLFLLPGFIIAHYFLWIQTNLFLSILLPTLLLFFLMMLNYIYGYLFESRARKKIKNIFEHYVPEQHIDKIINTPHAALLKGENKIMSVMFADIYNFTTLSEGKSANELVTLLNTFLTPMTEIIFKYQGTIDKYIGDLIMAFWGAPLDDSEHAYHAIACALEMQATTKKLQDFFEKQAWPNLKIRIGINTGNINVGDMGSRFRLNYTVLGDAVNLASRLESLAKFYDVEIIVGENTKKYQDAFIFRKLDTIRVKGKEENTAIYEPLCLKQNITSKMQHLLNDYECALTAYLKQEWDTSKLLFLNLKNNDPSTKIYDIYLTRIAAYQKNPPPSAWDGVFIHREK